MKILKIVIISILYSSIIAHDRDTGTETFEKKYVFISLGECCRLASYIRDSQLSEYAFPFDWMMSHDFEAIYQLFLHDFKDYLKIDNLKDLNFYDRTIGEFEDIKNFSYLRVLDLQYNIESRHDFPLENSIEQSYEEVMKKVNRRVKRLYRTLEREDIIIFLVRLTITREQAVRFKNLMIQKFPHTKFILVALHNTRDFKKDWAEPHIRNFYFDNPLYSFNIQQKKYEYNNGRKDREWAQIVSQLLREEGLTK